MNRDAIHVVGASQHNLKHLTLDIPLNRITVVTGVSGSGKSSLAFDTLYAEGQRRYIETFSPYARQFMDRMDRPHVERIEGIPPAIAIDSKDPVRTSRSTVGTMTEVTDYVKLLYARYGRLHCRGCGRPVAPESPSDVWRSLADLPEGAPLVITFPSTADGSTPAERRRSLARAGFDRVYREGRVLALEEVAAQDTEWAVVADRLAFRAGDRKRVLDSLELAYRFGGGRADVWTPGDGHQAFSRRLECAFCRVAYASPLPSLFSFNSPVGACDSCRGFGRVIGIDMDLIVPDPARSLAEGAVKPFGGAADGKPEYRDLAACCRRERIPMDRPFRDLTGEQRAAIVRGTSSYYGIEGYFRWLEGRTYKMHVRVFLSRYRSYDVCPACSGTRFKDEALLYTLEGRTIAQLYALNVDQALAFFAGFPLPESDEAGRMILGEVVHRLTYLKDVGLGYLTLDRQSRTLSGGEVQRVSLTSALGSALVNTLYVLDEPSIGLHPRDNHRLVRILKGLRDLSNTVVVVEHDPEIIRESDYLLDLGPKAGEAGGEVMYFGPTGRVNGSLTGEYLRGLRRIPVPARRRRPREDRWLTVRGAAEHNLKAIDVAIPLGCFVCLTGVSGSGKSTLAEEVLYKAVRRALGDPEGRPGRHAGIEGLPHVHEVVLVDQRAVGRTPRANALTYTKALDPIRTLLADTPEARRRGFGPGHFSFNTPGGRCETCSGDGFERVEMQFLSDVYITCPDCRGRRFRPDVLEVAYRGRTIADLLDMTVDRALVFFADQPKVVRALQPLADVGLGYIRLGQPISTMSGGESQRLKLSRHLRPGPDGRHTLFIFDEPTTGLHFEDIRVLLAALQRLVDAGHTVLVIEHNMDVVKTADWVIDLGPEGGEQGGRVVAAGPPETVAAAATHTGRFLEAYLNGGGRLKAADRPAAGVAEARAPYAARPAAPSIEIRGAREHNLQDIDIALPHHQLVVLTGVSGSGKSTLAFDILFAEGQRRYLESLAPYVRQYMKIMERPDVDVVSGLAPTVAIEQRISSAGRRSTVATLTETYHFLRLLYSKLGRQHCPGCGRPLAAQTEAAIVDQVRARFRRTPATLLAPKVIGRKGFHKEVFERARKQGLTHARVDGDVRPITAGMSLSRWHEHTIELVVGRLPARNPDELVRRGLKEGDGHISVLADAGPEDVFSLHGICPACGIGMEPLDPRLFSFNSRQGACPDCKGLGVRASEEEAEDVAAPVCPACNGSRLKPQALAVKIAGLSIWDLVQLPAADAGRAIRAFRFPVDRRPVARPITSEILARLGLLDRLGLSYLSLGRSGNTLSGGEAQRVRLAAQLGSNLTGVCYILDEPTIGLHPRDNHVLVEALKALRDRGNTIVVVEHDEETIRAADTLIDLGPGAGRDGGRVVATGSIRDLRRAPQSATGAAFGRVERALTSRNRPYRDGPRVGVRGATAHNLAGVDVDFPLGHPDRGHRRLRIGQVDAAEGNPLQGPAQPAARPPRPGRPLPRDHRLAGAAPRAGGRSQPDRPDAAFGPGLLRRVPGRDPAALRADARRPAPAATRPAASRSTSPAAAARPAWVRAGPRSR